MSTYLRIKSFRAPNIDRAAALIPESDFISARYDVEHHTAPTDILCILSTPRSGSTLLCELLRLNDVCIAHEYFQPAQYMPLAATRWGCLVDGALDEARYVAQLCRYRTYANGWLGINLHGSHLRYFLRMEQHLPAARLHYLHLIRRGTLEQAVSYEMAAQSRQWSSQFCRALSPVYDFGRIREKFRRIHDQNALIAAFLVTRKIEATTIFYEDLVSRPAELMNQMRVPQSRQTAVLQPTIDKQGGATNAEWVGRFANDLLASEAQSGSSGPITAG